MAQSRRSQRLNDAINTCVQDGNYTGEIYERWYPREARANHLVTPVVGKNIRKRPHQKNVLTCYEVNVEVDEETGHTHLPPAMERKLTMCTKCINYGNDKTLTKRLREAVDQFDKAVGVRYQCESLWIQKKNQPLASSPTKKSRSEDSTSPIPSVGDHSTPQPNTASHSMITPHGIGDKQATPEKCASSDPAQLSNLLPAIEKKFLQHIETKKLIEENCEMKIYIMQLLAKQKEELSTAGDIAFEKIETAQKQHRTEVEELKALHMLDIQQLKKQHAEQLHSNVSLGIEQQESHREQVRKQKELYCEQLSQQDELHRIQLRLLQEQHTKEISELSASNSDLHHHLERKEQVISSFEEAEKERQSLGDSRRFVEVPIDEEGLSCAIQELVEKTFAGKRIRRSTKVRMVVESAWNDLYDGAVRAELLQKAEPIIRRNNPYRKSEEILRVLDLHGCRINISALDQLRKGMEGADANPEVRTKRGESWMATTHYLKQSMRSLEEAGDDKIPFIMLDPEDGLDGICFKFKQLLLYILEMFGLLDIAKDIASGAVQIAITLDGADLSRNTSHVTAGIKIVDPRAIDPQSGIAIGLIGSTKVQSRELCFPFKIILCRDSKALYDDHFADFFAFFKDIVENGLDDIPPNRFLISSPQDMSSFWKSLKKGGACKVSKNFCHCCSCSSNNCCSPRTDRCPTCIASGREHCYHHEVGDSETIANLKYELEALHESHGFLSDTNAWTKLRVRLSPEETYKGKEISNIEFEPATSAELVRFGSQFLNHDLQLLSLPRTGNIDERRCRLRLALELIERAKAMQAGVDSGDYSGAHILIEQAIPCILHCENRCGEKIVKLLLVEGLKKCGGDSGDEQAMLKLFEETVNRRVLGHQWSPANWRLATQRDKDNQQVIADQTMPNQHVRKFIEKFDILLDICVEDPSRKEKWGNAVELWMLVMEQARQKEDFSDQQIEDFQQLCDDFYEAWIDLHGRYGITNYFHMVGAGHLSYYLRVWRNLYRYSQQGWESLNSLIKQYYFNRTQRGGHGGRADERNSKVKPIGRWLQRKLLFLSGEYKEIV